MSTKLLKANKVYQTKLVSNVVELYAESRKVGEALTKAYDELAKAVAEGHLTVGETIDLPDGRMITIIDNFTESNTIWRPVAVRHRWSSARACRPKMNGGPGTGALATAAVAPRATDCRARTPPSVCDHRSRAMSGTD